MKNKAFKQGDLVLKKLEATSNRESREKLAPKWDGPFRVTQMDKANAYHLQDPNGSHLPHVWHLDHFKLYHC